MTTLLVTGGAGFIGANLVHHLLAALPQARVVVYDALTYAGNLDNLASILDDPRLTFVQGDICNRDLVEQTVRQHRPDVVYNLAAESHVDRSIDEPGSFVRTNVTGTYEMLEGARAYWNGLTGVAKDRFRFLHVSTDEVYGTLGASGLFTEETAYAPNSPYAASKAAADHLVRAYFHTYGLPTLTTNCSNNYGPYQFPEKLIPVAVLNALEGKPLPVYGQGTNVRDWLYVEDHCRGLQTVAERGTPGQTYNIGGNNERTTLQVVETVCNLLQELAPGPSNYRERITFVRDRPGHDFRYAIDATKIRRDLGFMPNTSFEAGMRRTVQWYLDNREWCERIAQGSYRRERLGLAQSS